MREAQVPYLVWELKFHVLLQAARLQKNHKAKMRYSLSFRCKKPARSPPNVLLSPPHETGIVLEKAEGSGHLCSCASSWGPHSGRVTDPAHPRPQEQASWVCQCEEGVVQRLEQDFKLTLQQQSSLDQWASWLDNVVTQVLKQHAGSPSFPKAARQFLLKWSFYR